ncbi:mannosyl-oligosaccharide alpha-1,2-mannosidase [Talaromyces islandicus]|uniref:alpha-1,2-Mannosidase n=1 Tax=Talaromyces islandicus TaxID=28573 RepID=A0A0U1LX50_TALIS|nr:mannosyl-oligosaccharide alpha-1,2-mannosidase [Talaromyces islandicus]
MVGGAAFGHSSQNLHSQQGLDWRASSARSSGSLGGYGFSQSQTTTAANSSSNNGGISKINSFFGGRGSGRDLPVYKDKPYFKPRRTGPDRTRARIIYIMFALFVTTMLYVFWGGWGGPAEIGPSGNVGEELWKWVQTLDEDETSTSKHVDWAERRERVKDAFIISWDSYETYGWGYDEYQPVSKKGRYMVEGGMGWIIVDALDTMILMNLTSRVQHARNWIHNSLRYDQDHDVNTFETTIRMLGGLLSAHYLSTNYPNLAPIADDDVGAPGEDLYIEKATDLADRLLGAFESASGVPYASINLNTSTGIPSHADGGASSTAEATTVQLEFKYLAKLTGEAEYWQTVEKVMKVVDDKQQEDGLLPIFLYADTGEFRGNNIRLGSRGDSYYEYLIKQYLQTSEGEPIYKEMWDETLEGISKHLITYTKNGQMSLIAERPDGLHRPLLAKMDHLVCFMPGTIALGATGGQPLSVAKQSSTWSRRQDEEILLAKELAKTCWATYLATATGLAPEITYFRTDNPPKMFSDVYPDSTLLGGSGRGTAASKSQDLDLISVPLADTETWEQDIEIHAQDTHNLQRPETIESLLYMYRITGDSQYREWGWDMFKSFIKHTAVTQPVHAETDSSSDPSSSSPSPPSSSKRIVGFTSLSNANFDPPVQRDNMESFWMAETLKYFYLLFSEPDFIPLEDVVLNTEAHVFPRFKTGGDLKTGWARKPRV